MTAIFFALALRSPEFLPSAVTAEGKASLTLLAIVAELAGVRHPPAPTAVQSLRTGLIVGVLRDAWHFLVNFWNISLTLWQAFRLPGVR